MLTILLIALIATAQDNPESLISTTPEIEPTLDYPTPKPSANLSNENPIILPTQIIQGNTTSNGNIDLQIKEKIAEHANTQANLNSTSQNTIPQKQNAKPATASNSSSSLAANNTKAINATNVANPNNLFAQNATNNTKNQKETKKQTLIDYEDFDYTNAILKGNSVKDFIWCGNEDILVILTQEGNLYRSTNGGKTFTSQTKAIISSAEDKIDGDQNVGKANSLRSNQNENNPILFLFGTHGVNWLSKDCGAKWKVINTKSQISSINFHPYLPNVLLGSIYNPNCTNKAMLQEEQNDEDDDADENNEQTPRKVCDGTSDLYVSKDDGDSWELILSGIFIYDWATTSKNQSIQYGLPEERLMASKREYDQGEPILTLVVSDNYFKSATFTRKHISSFKMENHLLYISELKNYEGREIQLYVSMNTKDLKFSPISLPEGLTSSQNYKIISTENNGIFIIIRHEKEHNYGKLYRSDINGKYFTLLLSKIAIIDGNFQVEIVDGSEGVMIANVLTGDTKAKASIYKTYISYNMGASWKQLQAPATDMQGNKINCRLSKGCSLNLFNTEFIKSTENAHGIIISYGKVGKQISTQESTGYWTFMSRDGGRSWIMLIDKPLMSAIGDHGGIIAMMNKTHLFYSWDEASTWNVVVNKNFIVANMSDKTPIIINRFRPFPDSVTQKFIIVSYLVDSKQIVVTRLNFESLHERQCQIDENDYDSDNSDYELWSLNSIDEEECVLGHQIQYLKRKQNTQCYNGEKFEHVVKYKDCQCKVADYECDYGYKRTGEEGICEKDGNIERKYGEECSYGYSEYTISNGYRKITGDTCINGETYSIAKAPCRVISLSMMNILLVFGVLCVIALLVWKKKEVIILAKWWASKIPKRSKYAKPKEQDKEMGYNDEKIKFADENEVKES